MTENNEIRLLSPATINRIAAGEVIERPSSVVKELAENSIDAGSTAITIEITNGGKNLIRVTDNGRGIRADQIRAAFLKHSTSKITDADDLESIYTLGFRGEALSSIASVARVELITKTGEALFGVRYLIEDGREISYEEIGAPTGTTVYVRDLFGHIPARKKFLATDQAEASYIIDIAEKLALAHPEVSIRLIVGSKLRFMTSGSGKLYDVIYLIFGKDLSEKLIPLEGRTDGLTISGFIGKPEAARGNRGFELFSLNGRSIKSKLISDAVEEAFYGHLMQHRYPAAIINLELDPSRVDVNVHPSKLEVRFQDQKSIRDLVLRTIREALQTNELMRYEMFGGDETADRKPVYSKVSEVKNYYEPFEKKSIAAVKEAVAKNKNEKPDIEDEEDAFDFLKVIAEAVSEEALSEKSTEICESDIEARDGSGLSASHPEAAALDQPDDDLSEAFAPDTGKGDKNDNDGSALKRTVCEKSAADEMLLSEAKTEQLELIDDRRLSSSKRPDFKLIGIAFDTYFLVQYRDEFLMIDQHAAHEKVLYERFIKEFASGAVTGQRCDPPTVLSLSPREEAVLLDNMSVFEELGFEIEHFGGREYAIYSVPANMLTLSNDSVFIELLTGLSSGGDRRAGRLISERIAKMACKAAVKGSDSLTVPEAEALIDELLTLDDPYTCPHGRPTVISMTLKDIEKKFKRIIQ